VRRDISNWGRPLEATNRRYDAHTPARQLRMHSCAIVHAPLVYQTPRRLTRRRRLRRRHPTLPAPRNHPEAPPHYLVLALLWRSRHHTQTESCLRQQYSGTPCDTIQKRRQPKALHEPGLQGSMIVPVSDIYGFEANPKAFQDIAASTHISYCYRVYCTIFWPVELITSATVRFIQRPHL
jgi:hypothetical protein